MEHELIAISRSNTTDVIANVVFIHGLGGHPRETWQYDKTDLKSFWPKWVYDDLNAADEGISRPVGVWSLGYPAAIFEGLFFAKVRQDSIPQRAGDLVDTLASHGLANRPIIFVAHSLGGILVKQMLRRSSDAGEPRTNASARVAFSTRLVMFLATPHTGASIARVAEAVPMALTVMSSGLVSTISALPLGPVARAFANKLVRRGDLTKALVNGDPYLEDLSDWYRNNAPRIGVKTRAYYEKEKKGLSVIVDKESANPGVSDAEVFPIDADHGSICKPTSRNAHYRRMTEPLQDAIRQCPIFKETHLAAMDVGVRFEKLSELPVADRLSATKKVIQPLELRLGRNPAADPVDYGESASGDGIFKLESWQESLAGTSPYDLDRIILNVWHQYKGGLSSADPTRAVRLEAERLKIALANHAKLTLIPLYYAARALRVQKENGKVQLGDTSKNDVQFGLTLAEKIASNMGMDEDKSTRNALNGVLGSRSS